MKTILNLPPRVFKPGEEVEEAIRQLTEGEEIAEPIPELRWTYKEKRDPKGTGGSLIEVYDEDGEFVSYWSIPPFGDLPLP